ncbi:hypothetical protein Mapa_003851 [Marchantia paleacea]|nr:hypothetical protein Mapa_003851 [Marchantia paleacea]
MISRPSLKFPIDPNGDCDILSTGLMFAVGPTYDESSRHGLQVLNPTDSIWSPNTRFFLVMQLDCNLVLYDRQESKAIWSSQTQGQGSVCFAAITSVGELIVYDSSITDLKFRTNTWCSSNGGHCWTNTILEVQDDGNLVLYIFHKDLQIAIWSSKTVICEGGC